ncbi:MAG: alpha/beta hydrolase fold domain-containing protein [Planctomycetia bacterium]
MLTRTAQCIAVTVSAGALLAGGAERDWSAVELAWRGDPRATADAPFEAEAAPMRRPSRRAQRRATTRRRMPLDTIPVEVRPSTATPQPALDTRDVFAGVPDRPLGVETTLESPFASVPAVPTGTIVIHRGQPSLPTADARQRFDIYLPAGCSVGGMPLVVWIHGDTWRDGSRADCPVAWLADEGYVVASVGYRLTDTAPFPAQLDDCRAALDEIRRAAEVWGIDRDRIAVVGSGAGGHLAALVGLAAEAEPRVAAVCTVAAPTQLTSLGPEHDRPTSPASLLVGGPIAEFREAAQRASPLSFVSADDPPCLVIHGDRDESIPTAQSVAFDAALRAAGVDSTLLVLEGTGHRPGLGRRSPSGRALLEFFDRTLGPGLRSSPPRTP